MRTFIRRYWNKLITIRNRHSLDRGSALVIALLIMLALILLGLALLLQSNTEYAISLNERDSTATLANADATLQLAKAFVKDYSVSNPACGAGSARSRRQLELVQRRRPPAATLSLM